MLALIDYAAGVIQIANVLLALVAGVIAASLIKASQKRKVLAAWIPLIAVLVLFAAVEIFGTLAAFEIYSSWHITHLLASLALGLIIYSVIQQLELSQS